MSDANAPVTIQIMDNEYRVACPPEEREALLRAANYLNQRMIEIRDTGKVLGVERIAVMAALNISHELLSGEAHSHSLEDQVSARVDALRNKVDAALNKAGAMEV